MVLSQRKLIQALLKKGFVEQVAGRHKKYHFQKIDGTLSGDVWTVMSHSHDELDDYLISKVSHQMHLTKDDLVRFYNCPLQLDEYREILKSQGISI